jgi:hypothetical protein
MASNFPFQKGYLKRRVPFFYVGSKSDFIPTQNVVILGHFKI